MSQHTPTPWNIHQPSYNETPLIFGLGDDYAIAEISGVDQTNKEASAEFIVRACNAHEDLINALTGALEYIEEDCIESKDFTLNLIKEALKKAGVKE